MASASSRVASLSAPRLTGTGPMRTTGSVVAHELSNKPSASKR